ncbi:MAG: PQQ-binding-like beta-propeller repeat protein [Acidobacteria bacterium]|nr:PQQ-binding-like beta-propeller repeat protein [Acidobacteriota bacterium]
MRLYCDHVEAGTLELAVDEPRGGGLRIMFEGFLGNNRRLVRCVVGAIVCVSALPLNAQAPLEQTVRPFVERNCVKCHNAALTMGNIDFEQLLASRDSLVRQRAVWETVSYVLRVKQMPPAGQQVPPETDVAAVIEAVSQELGRAAAEAATAKALAGPATPDWLTFGYDPERTGWARAETTLTEQNVSGLKLLWKAQLDAIPNPINYHSTITAPLVVENVQTRQGPKTLVLVAGANNSVYAIDNESGTLLWKKEFPNTETPRIPDRRSCPNTLNATPVIDKAKGTIYFLASDGKVRGLSLADGELNFPPTRMFPSYSRNFSLNLIDGMLYAGAARGCGGVASQIAAMDVDDPEQRVSHFFPSPGKGSGPWGRGGIVKSPSGVLAQTADGTYDPAAGRFGETILGFTPDMLLTDSYTPANADYLNMKDLDLGSGTPITFPFGGRNLIAASAKEGVIYLLDADSLGGADHRTPLYLSPRYGNDIVKFGFNGVWGAMATWVDAQGQRWLMVPMLGPLAKDTVGSFKTVHGSVVNGSVMAFTVQLQDDKPVLVPEWMSGDLDLPGSPIIANGMVFVLANGERASDAFRAPARNNATPRPPPQERRLPLIEVDPDQPGFERDAAWRAAQLGDGGQVNGQRYSGGRDVTHAILYALDAQTGAELYTSGGAIDSWNHYGSLAVMRGRVYLSTYDARVYAFGLGDKLE